MCQALVQNKFTDFQPLSCFSIRATLARGENGWLTDNGIGRRVGRLVDGVLLFVGWRAAAEIRLLPLWIAAYHQEVVTAAQVAVTGAGGQHQYVTCLHAQLLAARPTQHQPRLPLDKPSTSWALLW